MQVRRALLLFALVLGLAAVAASLAPPPEERREDEPPRSTTPAREPAQAGPGPRLAFNAGAERPERRRIASGEPATVIVEVDAPGQVEMPGLGLVGFAEPDTPSVFEVLVPEPGRYEITYRPVDGRPRRVGVLEVTAPPS